MEREKEIFTSSIHCQSGSHCNICRRKISGHGWRRSLMSLFILPNNEVDFVCPYGKPWAVEPIKEISGITNTNTNTNTNTISKQTENVPQTTQQNTNKKDCGCKRKRK